MSTLDTVTARLRELGCAKGSGQDWQCPNHDDEKASLGVTTGIDGKVLLYCQAGCTTLEVVERLGLKMADLFPAKAPEMHYNYIDEDGSFLFQVVRNGDKKRCRRPDKSGIHHFGGHWEPIGGWVNDIKGVWRVLFRLPEIIDAVQQGKTIWVAEGEKDATNLAEIGVEATCNPFGAGKWKDEYSEVLRGAKVVVVADRDDAGYEHARAVAASLEPVAASVRVVEAAEGNDASDHLAAGLGLDDFQPVDAGSETEFDKKVREQAQSIRVHEAARALVQAEKEAARYREPPDSRTLEQELANRPEPTRWAIPDWAPDGGNAGIEAKKKAGKTTLMGNVAKCLVDHLPFLGNEEWLPRELSGNVGYCNLELPEWQFIDWLEDMSIKNASCVIPWHLRGYRMPMNVDLVVERYIDWLKDHDIEVWILDPRNRAWQGMVTDENNNSQVNEWSAQVDFIKREAGVRECYIPAHMGHEHERGRGASAWGDWLDATWKLTSQSGTRFLGAEDSREVEQPKRKLLYNSGTRLLTIGSGSPEDVKRQRRIQSVINALRNGMLNTRDLRDTMRDCQKDDRATAIREAIGDDYVATMQEGRATIHYLTDKGQQHVAFF